MGLFDIFTKKAKEREQKRLEEENRVNALVWNLVSEKRWEDALTLVATSYSDETTRAHLIQTIKDKRAEVAQAERDARLQRMKEERERQKREEQERKELAQKERKKQKQEIMEKENAFAEKYNKIVSNLEYIAPSVSSKPAKKRPLYLLDDITYSTIGKRSTKKSLADFVAVDVETTGLAPSNSEIVEIAAVRFRDFTPISCFTSLLFPKKGIDKEAQEINGITSEMVEGKPTFPQIADSFIDFIGNDTLIGHNLEFDLGFIVKHGADVTEEKRKYHDTLKIAKKLIKKKRTVWDSDLEDFVPDFFDEGIDDYGLDTLCHWYGIFFPFQHRAVTDALATGFLFEKLYEEKMAQTPQRYETARVSEIILPSQETLNVNHPLYGKRIVFTGILNLDRHSAMQMAANVGALVKSAVSSKTDYLVVGKQDVELVGSDGMSGKEEKAHELNACGKSHVEIIDEEKFLELVSWGKDNDMP